jgi:hypothetical protein
MRSQHDAHRPVRRYRVTGRAHCAKVIAALSVGAKFSAQVHRFLGRILVFVQSLWRGLPDIDQRIGEWLAMNVAHLPRHQHRRAGRADARNRVADGAVGRAQAPERAEQGMRRLAVVLVIVAQRYQGRNAQHVGAKDHFVVRIGIRLAQRADEAQAGVQLVFAQVDFPDQRVRMLDQCADDLLQARIGGVGERGEGNLGDRSFGVDNLIIKHIPSLVTHSCMRIGG